MCIYLLIISKIWYNYKYIDMLAASYVNSDIDSIGNSALMNRLFVLIGATVDCVMF